MPASKAVDPFLMVIKDLELMCVLRVLNLMLYHRSLFILRDNVIQKSVSIEGWARIDRFVTVERKFHVDRKAIGTESFHFRQRCQIELGFWLALR